MASLCYWAKAMAPCRRPPVLTRDIGHGPWLWETSTATANQTWPVVNVYSGNVSVLLGNGDSAFQVPVSYDVGPSPRSVVIGDFNGDSRPDLAVANSAYGGGTPSVSVLLGKGDGNFGPAVNYSAGMNPWSVAVGDF